MTHHAPQQIAETRILSLTSVVPLVVRVSAVLPGSLSGWYNEKVDVRGLAFQSPLCEGLLKGVSLPSH